MPHTAIIGQENQVAESLCKVIGRHCDGQRAILKMM